MRFNKNGMATAGMIIIAVVAVLVGWGLIYVATKNAQSPSKIPSTEEITESVNDALDSAREAGRQEYVQEEIDAYIAMLEELSDFLSDQGKSNAEVVLTFVQENPSVLYDTSVEVPNEVKEAYRSLSAEVEEIKQSVGYSEPTNSEAEDTFGTTTDITGILEISELSEKGVGTMFKVVDEDDGFNYYFILNSSETQRMLEDQLVGERVSVNVEITGQVENGVTYKVLSGPNLAD